MKPLYEIAEELQSMLASVDDGEVPLILQEQLDSMEDTLEAKLENCCKAVRNLEAEANALNEEAKHLARRAKAAKMAAERLEEYILWNLGKLGLTKADAGIFHVRVQSNSMPTVEFTGDPSALPPKFQRVKVELDREAARQASERGEQLPSGVTVTKKTHLRIT